MIQLTSSWQRRILVLWLMALLGALIEIPAAAVTVRLDANDAHATVLLHLQDRLRVDLTAAPSKGYRWKARLLDASHLELLGNERRPGGGRLDSSVLQSYVWKAISPGTANIELIYGRPDDDRTVAPAKTIMIFAEIAGGILDADDSDAQPGAGPVKEQYLSTLQRAAVYQGTLPCEGCSGIDVELDLFRRQDNKSTSLTEPGIFLERRRYRGAPEGDRTVAGTGRLTVLHGTYADAAATVYVLAAADGDSENFKVEGDRLAPLDRQMLPLQLPPGAFGLQRVTDTGNACAARTCP